MYDISSFFFNDTATTEIYTLSLHDALPISQVVDGGEVEQELGVDRLVDQESQAGANLCDVGLVQDPVVRELDDPHVLVGREDRKSTRLNSSHANISYAVFCLKKKKNTIY